MAHMYIMDSILIYINVDQKDITFYLPSYVQYSTIAARAVRQALKGDAKEAASKRGKLNMYSSGEDTQKIYYLRHVSTSLCPSAPYKSAKVDT